MALIVPRPISVTGSHCKILDKDAIMTARVDTLESALSLHTKHTKHNPDHLKAPNKTRNCVGVCYVYYIKSGLS